MIDTLSLLYLPVRQSRKLKPLYLISNNYYFNLRIIHHRYFLDGDRPSQTTKNTILLKTKPQKILKMVLQGNLITVY